MTETINNPIRTKELFNPTGEDFQFKYDSASYVVPAGGRAMLLEHIAVHGAKKMADKYKSTNDPAEHQVYKEAFLTEQAPETVAEKLGIDLKKIRSKASTEKKKEADLINVKDLIKRQSEELERLKAIVEGKKEVEEVKEPVKVEKKKVTKK